MHRIGWMAGLIGSLCVLGVLPVGCAKRAATASGVVASAAREPSRATTPAERRPQAPPTAERRSASTGAVSAPQPPPGEFVSTPELGDIYFDFDRYAISAQAERILMANAEFLRAHPKWLVLVEGHCDERGTSEYNLALGERRARAAVNVLVSQGIAASRIGIISYGKERPACRDRNEACWARNRRAHFLVKAVD